MVRNKRPAAIAIAVLLAFASAGPTAQNAPPLQFEAASIRRANPAARGASMDVSAGGRVTFRNTTIRGLLVAAFGIRNIEGAPPWVGTETYDVVATAGRAVTQQQRNRMLVTLLGERLKLRTRVDIRDQPAYALMLVRANGRLGPDIARSTLDCAAIAASPRDDGPGPLAPNGSPACGFTQSSGVMKRSGASMAAIAASLSAAAGRQVVDRTGLPGAFDYTLRYSPNPDQPTEDYPSVFTAVREQLGLKLEPTNSPAQFLVIDAIERPSEN